jgi:hypothetical protein
MEGVTQGHENQEAVGGWRPKFSINYLIDKFKKLRGYQKITETKPQEELGTTASTCSPSYLGG